MAKIRPRPQRPAPVSKLTLLERLYLSFDQNPHARAVVLLALVLPALLVVGIFWWNVSFRRPSLAVAPSSVLGDPPILQVAEPRLSGEIPDGLKMPAEFERQDGMLLGFNELVEFHPQVLVDMVAALADKLEVYGIVNNAEQRQKVLSLLEQHKVPTTSVRTIEAPASGMWVRDYGPKFLRNDVGGLTMVDYAYLDIMATDGKTRPQDDVLPGELSKLFRMPLAAVPLSMEGGNLLNNGYGFVVSTTQLVLENSHRRYSVADVGKLINSAFGQTNWSYVNFLEADATRHADTFMTFTDHKTLVVASCDPKQDARSAATLDKAAEQLATMKSDDPQHPYLPLTIVRMPMEMKGDGVIRTYTNVVFANGTLLVPQYADVAADTNRNALEIYRRILPGWKVVGIECLSIAKMGGALHCVTCNVPSPSLLPVDLNVQ